MPTRHLHRGCVTRLAFPDRIGRPVRGRVGAPEHRSVFARGSPPRLLGSRRGGAIQHPVFGKAEEFVTGNPLRLQEERHVAIPSIGEEKRTRLPLTLRQTRHHRAQLPRRHFGSGRCTLDALVVEDIRPTARRGRQHAQRRELPPRPHGLETGGQVRRMNPRPVFDCVGKGTQD